MITFPLPRGWFMDPYRPKDFAAICPISLKVWAVCGEGRSGFLIERIPSIECGYGEEAKNWVLGPSWHFVPGSVLSTLEGWLNSSLSRQTPTVVDIMGVLPPPLIRHEFEAHLRWFDWFIKETDYESESETDPDPHPRG